MHKCDAMLVIGAKKFPTDKVMLIPDYAPRAWCRLEYFAFCTISVGTTLAGS